MLAVKRAPPDPRVRQLLVHVRPVVKDYRPRERGSTDGEAQLASAMLATSLTVDAVSRELTPRGRDV